MGRRVLFIFETLIMLTLFLLFGSLAATTLQNDAIRDTTESFAEVVRYKGCVTRSMYDDLLASFPTAVEVNFEVTKKPALVTSEDIKNMEFTNEVIAGVYGSTGIYTMQTGDMFSVIVHKASPTWFDTVVGAMTGGGTTQSPVIAVKGGMILNEQYDTGSGGGGI